MKATGVIFLALLPGVGRPGLDSAMRLPSRAARMPGAMVGHDVLSAPPRRNLAASQATPALPKDDGAPSEPVVAAALPRSVEETWSYDKGDHARDIHEFSAALKGDFVVSHDANAENPEKFARRLTVYGEDHLNPKLPSIPGGRGIVMFESKDPERCIGKYAEHASNQCVSIDHHDLSAESQAFRRMQAAMYDMLDVISPHAVREVESQLGPRATSQEFMLRSIRHAVKAKEEFDARGDLERAQLLLDKLEAAVAVVEQAKGAIDGRIGLRDDYMFDQATSKISELSPDEAATIVVGDAHADKLVARLRQTFPERAVVQCRPVVQPVDY